MRPVLEDHYSPASGLVAIGDSLKHTAIKSLTILMMTPELRICLAVLLVAAQGVGCQWRGGGDMPLGERDSGSSLVSSALGIGSGLAVSRGLGRWPMLCVRTRFSRPEWRLLPTDGSNPSWSDALLLGTSAESGAFVLLGDGREAFLTAHLGPKLQVRVSCRIVSGEAGGSEAELDLRGILGPAETLPHGGDVSVFSSEGAGGTGHLVVCVRGAANEPHRVAIVGFTLIVGSELGLSCHLSLEGVREIPDGMSTLKGAGVVVRESDDVALVVLGATGGLRPEVPGLLGLFAVGSGEAGLASLPCPLEVSHPAAMQVVGEQVSNIEEPLDDAGIGLEFVAVGASGPGETLAWRAQALGGLAWTARINGSAAGASIAIAERGAHQVVAIGLPEQERVVLLDGETGDTLAVVEPPTGRGVWNFGAALAYAQRGGGGDAALFIGAPAETNVGHFDNLLEGVFRLSLDETLELQPWLTSELVDTGWF